MADGWEIVPSLLDIGPSELQIWRIDLAEATQLPDIFWENLSVEELDRSKRLRAGQVRLQFLVARTCLRMLLANILDLDPKTVPIILNAYGKPETPAAGGYPLHFNLAHSRETILIALCRECPVGIDLEYLDRETEVLEVARNFFHQDEFHHIAAIADPELRRRAFFHCWTRKEAIIKADGRGLSLPLTTFKVPVAGSAIAAPVTISEEEADKYLCESGTAQVPHYFVSDLALGNQIAAAYAFNAPNLQARRLLFPLPHL